MKVRAATLQFTYREFSKAIEWYTNLFGRPADFVSSAEFQEWEVFPDFWLQIAAGDLNHHQTRLRFGVENVEQERENLYKKLGIITTDKFYTRGVVLLYNFKDPWGYKLGIFQDLQTHPLPTQQG